MRDGQILSCELYPSPNPNVELSLITYYSDGLKVKGLLAEPKKEGRFDAFLYLRGGIKGVGMVRPARIAQFAQEGFIVFAPFYRGNRGGEGNEDFAGEDRNDAFSAYNLLKAHPRTTSRIHVFGFSRGGVMALQAAIHFPETTSAVTWGGVSDMVLTYEERKDLRRMMKRVIGGSPKKVPDLYRWRTPIADLSGLEAPVLIIHGALDDNVSVEHAYRLQQALQQSDKRYEAWYYDRFHHVFPPDQNRETVRQLCSWMKKQI